MNKKLTHGGDWAGFLAAHGKEALDFSANISPLGIPDGVRKALAASADLADRYPDPLCRSLCEALSQHDEVPADHILCGAGAADLIFRVALALRPKTALVTAPAFSEYETALGTVDCEVRHYLLPEDKDFRPQEDILTHITPEIDVFFLCEPNNPSGVTTPKPLLHRILDRCRETGTVLVLDECFVGLLADPAGHTMKGCLKDYPNLLILKAFTKLYALAGVRLGYALCADTELLEKMRLVGQPWAVSTVAQTAGLAALKEVEYEHRVRALITTERPWLAQGLRDLGLRVIPGEANYLLFRSETPLLAPLEERGILVRSCANYIGLDETWYRTAVRTHGENERLLKALGEVLA